MGPSIQYWIFTILLHNQGLTWHNLNTQRITYFVIGYLLFYGILTLFQITLSKNYFVLLQQHKYLSWILFRSPAHLNKEEMEIILKQICYDIPNGRNP